MNAWPIQPDRRPAVRLRRHDRSHQLDLPFLRRLLQAFVGEHLGRADSELDIHIVSRAQITRLNETYLRHQGATDVITFDYSQGPGEVLRGEIFVCLPEALVQARRFRTTWQRELVRYLVHAVLHLCGYNDRTGAERRKMKQAEDTALRSLAARFPLEEVGRRSRSPQPGRGCPRPCTSQRQRRCSEESIPNPNWQDRSPHRSSAVRTAGS